MVGGLFTHAPYPPTPGSRGCAGATISQVQLGAPPGHPHLGLPLRPTVHLKPLPHPCVMGVIL